MATNIEMDEATYEDVNDTELHDAIMRAWYTFDKYYSLLMRLQFMRQPCSSILQGESAILMRTGRGTLG